MNGGCSGKVHSAASESVKVVSMHDPSAISNPTELRTLSCAKFSPSSSSDHK